MESLTLTAPDISCDHCKATIERAVGSLSGVSSVHVDVPTRRIHVKYDGKELERDTIIATLDDEGYPVTS